MILCGVALGGRGIYVGDVIYKSIYKYLYLSQINKR
jgi:hypothetical protein